MDYIILICSTTCHLYIFTPPKRSPEAGDSTAMLIGLQYDLPELRVTASRAVGYQWTIRHLVWLGQFQSNGGKNVIVDRFWEMVL
jgi:hypothetical protein